MSHLEWAGGVRRGLCVSAGRRRQGLRVPRSVPRARPLLLPYARQGTSLVHRSATTHGLNAATVRVAPQMRDGGVYLNTHVCEDTRAAGVVVVTSHTRTTRWVTIETKRFLAASFPVLRASPLNLLRSLFFDRCASYVPRARAHLRAPRQRRRQRARRHRAGPSRSRRAHPHVQLGEG